MLSRSLPCCSRLQHLCQTGNRSHLSISLERTMATATCVRAFTMLVSSRESAKRPFSLDKKKMTACRGRPSNGAEAVPGFLVFKRSLLGHPNDVNGDVLGLGNPATSPITLLTWTPFACGTGSPSVTFEASTSVGASDGSS